MISDGVSRVHVSMIFRLVGDSGFEEDKLFSRSWRKDCHFEIFFPNMVDWKSKFKLLAESNRLTLVKR